MRILKGVIFPHVYNSPVAVEAAVLERLGAAEEDPHLVVLRPKLERLLVIATNPAKQGRGVHD